MPKFTQTKYAKANVFWKDLQFLWPVGTYGSDVAGSRTQLSYNVYNILTKCSKNPTNATQAAPQTHCKCSHDKTHQNRHIKINLVDPTHLVNTV